MNHYTFIAANQTDLDWLNNVAARAESSQSIALNSPNELSILLNLFGSGVSIVPNLTIENLRAVWSASTVLNQVSEDDFEQFYRLWIEESGRDNTMDEYGQLQQLNAFVPTFNDAKHKLIGLESV